MLALWHDAPLHVVLAATFVASCTVAIGCGPSTPKGKTVVSEVRLSRIQGDEVVDLTRQERSALHEGIATHEEGIFDRDALELDLARIETYFRDRGYYDARIRTVRVVPQGESNGSREVRVEIELFEGLPVAVTDVKTVGLEAVPPDVGKAAKREVTVTERETFTTEAMTRTEEALRRALADRGYAHAQVKSSAEVSVFQQSASVKFIVKPGPKTTFGDVKIEGLDELSEDVIRPHLGFARGDPYSEEAIDEARSALLGLRVLAEVNIKPDLSTPDATSVPVVVNVRENKLRSIHVGAGARADSAKITAFGSVGWENLNFFGGLRRFIVNVSPGLVVYPGVLEVNSGRNVLGENAVAVLLEQPNFFEERTVGTLSSEYRVYPLLYSNINVDDPVVGFHQIANTAGVSRAFFEFLSFSLDYNALFDFPIGYVGSVPEGLDSLTISYPEISAILDFRDDRVEPTRGFYTATRLQFAGGPFFGDVTDLKIQPEARAFIPLGAPFGRRLTLAVRTGFGFLFPRSCSSEREGGCYGTTLSTDAAAVDRDDPLVVRDQQILAFRALYSGGANSNRGYNARGVGPHGVVSFLVPPTVDCTVQVDLRSCNHALGGLSLWEASLELRWLVADPFGVALFVDASDVTRGEFDFRLDFPHLSAGGGLRVVTPVGAVRLDLGVRLPGLQQIGEDELPRDEGFTDTLGEFPGALHFAVGQSY